MMVNLHFAPYSIDYVKAPMSFKMYNKCLIGDRTCLPLTCFTERTCIYEQTWTEKKTWNYKNHFKYKQP